MAKYFFLSDGWTVGRIWESSGLWNEVAWRRKPQIQQLNLSIREADERLWLYQVEDAILMVEVKPGVDAPPDAIGQVVLKRLMDAEKVLTLLCAHQSSQQAIGDRTERNLSEARYFVS
ncbi:MAG: hypothetical protein ACFB4J_01715 [Elainellaceae cyanobacterium]